MTPQLGRPQPPHDPAALARAILAQPRFRVRVQTPPSHTWWDSLRGWIADRWDQLMQAFSHHVHVGKGWSIAAGNVLIAAIVAIVIIVAVRLLLSMAREAGTPSGVHATALPVHADARGVQEAALAAQEGAYAIAIALLFQSALALLDARGLLRDDPSRTVNECRSDVRRRAPHLSASFDRLARHFTAAVYAEERMSAAQWSDALDAFGAFTAVHGNAA